MEFSTLENISAETQKQLNIPYLTPTPMSKKHRCQFTSLSCIELFMLYWIDILCLVLFLCFSQAASPQPGGHQTGGSLKTMKEKSVQADKEVQEGSALKTAGADREITAGLFINFTY